MSDTAEKQFLEKARAALDQSGATLDAATLAHLRAARARALAAEAPAPRARYRPRFGWALVGAAAGAAAVAVALWLSVVPTPVQLARSLDDLDILTANENPEFYAELEFYRWLASQRDAG